MPRLGDLNAMCIPLPRVVPLEHNLRTILEALFQRQSGTTTTQRHVPGMDVGGEKQPIFVSATLVASVQRSGLSLGVCAHSSSFMRLF